MVKSRNYIYLLKQTLLFYIHVHLECVHLECVFIIEHVEYVIFKAILYFCKDFVRTIPAILLHYQNHMYWHFKDIGYFM